MTDDEWDGICVLIENGFAHSSEFDEGARKVYRMLLNGYDAEQVSYAIQVLIRGGQRFRPAVAEILVPIHADPTEPTFDQMIEAVFRAGGILRARVPSKPFFEPGERERLEDEAALDRCEQLHPLIQGFVGRVGLAWIKTMDELDGEYGWARRRDLREAWDEWVGDVTERKRLGLEPPRMRPREVAVAAREGLRRIDLKAIEGGQS